MVVQQIELYNILRTRFTDDESLSIVGSMKGQMNEFMEERKDVFATKEDLSNLKTELKDDIARLDTKISDKFSETIRWMFIFWIGQTASVLAIMKFFMK